MTYCSDYLITEGMYNPTISVHQIIGVRNDTATRRKVYWTGLGCLSSAGDIPGLMVCEWHNLDPGQSVAVNIGGTVVKPFATLITRNDDGDFCVLANVDDATYYTVSNIINDGWCVPYSDWAFVGYRLFNIIQTAITYGWPLYRAYRWLRG